MIVNSEELNMDEIQDAFNQAKIDLNDDLYYDYYWDEIKLTKKYFDLNTILTAQRNLKIQIIRGADLQFECHIDGGVWAICLTPMYTLITGIKNYYQHHQ